MKRNEQDLLKQLRKEGYKGKQLLDVVRDTLLIDKKIDEGVIPNYPEQDQEAETPKAEKTRRRRRKT